MTNVVYDRQYIVLFCWFETAALHCTVVEPAITLSAATTGLPPSTTPLTAATSSAYADTSTVQPTTTGHTFLFIAQIS